MFFPFVFAFALAVFVRKIADKLKHFTGLGTRAGGLACLVLVYILCLVSIFLISRFLINEFTELIKILPNIFSQKIEPFFNGVVEKISHLNISNLKIYDVSRQLSQTLSNFAKNTSAKALSFIAQAVLQLPQIIFSVFVCVLSSFFICFDYQNIKIDLMDKLSHKNRNKIKVIKNVIKNTAIKMLSCYGILFAITFSQLFVGFLLLDIKHAFVLSFVIALCDIFPMIGVGTVLVPWSAACFIAGKIPLGVGLLCLFLIITILRNILEPKIIGRKMGIHPLLSLFIVYVGISFGGVFTAVFLLFITTVMKYLNCEIP